MEVIRGRDGLSIHVRFGRGPEGPCWAAGGPVAGAMSRLSGDVEINNQELASEHGIVFVSESAGGVADHRFRGS